jgi:hypothetical protein
LIGSAYVSHGPISGALRTIWGTLTIIEYRIPARTIRRR